MRQKLMRNPIIQYVSESGEPPQIDLVVGPDLRFTFTEDSFNALIQKVADLTGWDLLSKQAGLPEEPGLIESNRKSLTPADLMAACKEDGLSGLHEEATDIDYRLIDSDNRAGIDWQTRRKARG